MMLIAALQFCGIAPKSMRSADNEHHPDPHFINVASSDWKRRLKYWQQFTNRERFANPSDDLDRKMPQSLLGTQP